MSRRELTDAEIDTLLERFDQTEPGLQRRIIARFVGGRETLLAACEEALIVLESAVREGCRDRRGVLDADLAESAVDGHLTLVTLRSAIADAKEPS